MLASSSKTRVPSGGAQRSDGRGGELGGKKKREEGEPVAKWCEQSKKQKAKKKQSKKKSQPASTIQPSVALELAKRRHSLGDPPSFYYYFFFL